MNSRNADNHQTDYSNDIMSVKYSHYEYNARLKFKTSIIRVGFEPYVLVWLSRIQNEHWAVSVYFLKIVFFFFNFFMRIYQWFSSATFGWPAPEYIDDNVPPLGTPNTVSRGTTDEICKSVLGRGELSACLTTTIIIVFRRRRLLFSKRVYPSFDYSRRAVRIIYYYSSL